MKVKILDDFELAKCFKPAIGLVVDVINIPERSHISVVIKHSSWDTTQSISKSNIEELTINKEEQLQQTIDELKLGLDKAQKQLEEIKMPEIEVGQVWEDKRGNRTVIVTVCDNWVQRVGEEKDYLSTMDKKSLRNKYTLIGKSDLFLRSK